jgi:hypothetical protein
LAAGRGARESDPSGRAQEPDRPRLSYCAVLDVLGLVEDDPSPLDGTDPIPIVRNDSVGGDHDVG